MPLDSALDANLVFTGRTGLLYQLGRLGVLVVDVASGAV